MGHALGKRRTLVRNHVRHVGAEEDVAEENRGHDRHRQSDNTSGRFKQQRDTTNCHDEVKRRRLPRTRRQLRVEDIEIRCAEGREQRQNPVLHGNPRARRTLQRREEQVTEEEREREVNRARLRIVEHEHAKREWQRRSNPQLERGPSQRHVHHDPGRQPLRSPAAGIRFGDELPDLFIGHSRLVNFVLTHQSPLIQNQKKANLRNARRLLIGAVLRSSGATPAVPYIQPFSL